MKATARRFWRKERFWSLLAVLILPVLISAVWYYRQVRQQRLDHALIEAIKKNDTPAAIALLDQGADANATDRPVMPMTLSGVLADVWNTINGDKPKEKTQNGSSALLLAEFPLYMDNEGPYSAYKYPDEHPHLIEALLEHGANPYATDKDGMNVLHWACRYNHSKTVRVLLEHGVKPNVKDNYGRTPLLIWGVEDDSARLLTEYGADTKASDNMGRTPLMNGYKSKTCQLLLDRKADVNAKDILGQTALIHASVYFAHTLDDETRVRLLLQYGAKVAIRDKRDKTALDYVRQRRDTDKTLDSLLASALMKEQAQKGRRR